MKSSVKSESESTKLRRRAEASLSNRPKSATSSPGTEDPRRLIHELEVHQIELEMQNEELHRAKAELEANYNELYDYAPVGYFTLGRYGTIVKTNLTGAAMLGPARGELIGRRLASFINSDSLPYFNDFLFRVMSGSNQESCMVTLMKGGDTPVTAYIQAAGAHPNSDFRAVVVDITAAEHARRALRESEARLKLALDASNMGVWEWESNSRDINWSPECSRISGVDAICPTLDTLAPLLHPEDAERVIGSIKQVLAGGNEKSVECRIIRPDGRTAWISARGEVQFDYTGKPLRLIGIAQDITARKRAEEHAGHAQR
jgi:PAS domain S-box-containing protein